MRRNPQLKLGLVIATYKRPERALRAVKSACASRSFAHVVLVDDASPNLELGWDQAAKALDPRVEVLALRENVGVSAARNAGLQALERAGCTHAMFLDDDDALIPEGVNRLWRRAQRAAGDVWVGGVLTEKEGQITGRRWPASTRTGEVWGLDERRGNGRFFSWDVKQTAIVPLAVLRAAGAFDAHFRTRVWTEIFYRLSAVARIRRIFKAVYVLNRDRGLDRLTGQQDERIENQQKLFEKHAVLFAERPIRRIVANRIHTNMLEK